MLSIGAVLKLFVLSGSVQKLATGATVKISIVATVSTMNVLFSAIYTVQELL